MAKAVPAPKPDAKSAERLAKLFEERDRSKQGSADEKRASEEILETIFPDTDAR